MGLKYFREDERNRLFEAIDDPDDYIMFRIMYLLGLRIGEVTGEELDYWTKDGKQIWHKHIPDEIKNAAKQKERIEIQLNCIVKDENDKMIEKKLPQKYVYNYKKDYWSLEP